METKQSQKGIRGSLPGVPKVSEMDKLRRYALRALRLQQATDAEFKNALALGPNEEATERGVQVIMAAEARLRAFTKLERLNEAKAAAETDARREQVQEARVAQMAVIKSMARLGFTQDEWDVLDPAMKAEPSGRPSLALETRVVRAREGYAQTVANLRAEEKKRNLPRTDLSKVHDPVYDESRPGRKKLDVLGQLDRELAYRERRLAEMIYVKENPEAIKVTLSKHKVPTGRKRMPIDDRIREEKEKIIQIKQVIREQESRLDENGLIERKLKLLRNEATNMRLDLKKATSSERKQIATNLQAVEKQITKLIAKRENTSSGTASSEQSETEVRKAAARAEEARKAQIREEEKKALADESRRVDEQIEALRRKKQQLEKRQKSA